MPQVVDVLDDVLSGEIVDANDVARVVGSGADIAVTSNDHHRALADRVMNRPDRR